MFAAGLSGLAEIKEYTRRTIDTMTGDERCSDQSQEPRVLLSSMRYRLMQPRVVATASNLQDSAHHLDIVLISICLDKLVRAADLPLCSISSALVFLCAGDAVSFTCPEDPGKSISTPIRRSPTAALPNSPRPNKTRPAIAPTDR
jgi:hypothetical protein